MNTWPVSLIREISERRVVIFIGAGISKSALNQLPTWSNLINNLAENLQTRTEKKLVSKMVSKGLLLDAAQIVSDGINAPDLATKLTDIFKVKAPHSDVYKNILSLDAKVVITTNYDQFIEKNFDHFTDSHSPYSVFKQSGTNLLDNIRSPSRALIKIHGCISDPSDLILDRSSYFRLKQKNPATFSTLSALFHVNTVLFLGYSVSDPDMQLILESINQTNQAQNGHYALLAKMEHPSLQKSLKNSYNISVVEYPRNNHTKAIDMISELYQKVISFREEHGII